MHQASVKYFFSRIPLSTSLYHPAVVPAIVQSIQTLQRGELAKGFLVHTQKLRMDPIHGAKFHYKKAFSFHSLFYLLHLEPGSLLSSLFFTPAPPSQDYGHGGLYGLQLRHGRYYLSTNLDIHKKLRTIEQSHELLVLVFYFPLSALF